MTHVACLCLTPGGWIGSWDIFPVSLLDVNLHWKSSLCPNSYLVLCLALFSGGLGR